MKIQSGRFTRPVLAVLAVVPLLGVGGLLAQAQAPGGQQQMGKMAMQVDEDQARAMMAEREKMMASMRALDQKLDELVGQMKSATGAARVDAIANVAAALVEQRTAMRGQMMGMQDRMMGHMMQHMMSGMMGRGGQSGSAPSMMMSCPMMQQLQKEAGEEDHSAHHPPA